MLLVCSETEQIPIKHELVEEYVSQEKNVYYITDIHLEDQMKEILCGNDIDFCNIKQKIHDFIEAKVNEMLSGIDDKTGILLVGGDVSHFVELYSFFYQQLSWNWRGTIISILGNHELWDFSLTNTSCPKAQRTVPEIIIDYRSRVNKTSWSGDVKCALLQNSVYIFYKNKRRRIIEESQIMSAADEDLRDICIKSSFIVLGGIGFSGLNPKFNAEFGLYRSTVTTHQEDMELTEQFRAVYDKLNRCAGDRQVIVLTHICPYMIGQMSRIIQTGFI